MHTRGARARPSARVLPRSDDRARSLARSRPLSLPRARGTRECVRERASMRRARSRPLPHRSALVCARCPTARANECASVDADVGCVPVVRARASRAHARTRERTCSRRPHAAARSEHGKRTVRHAHIHRRAAPRGATGAQPHSVEPAAWRRSRCRSRPPPARARVHAWYRGTRARPAPPKQSTDDTPIFPKARNEHLN